MRALVDIVQNVTSSIRYIIGIIVFAIIAFGMMFSAGIAFVAPKAAESVAESAERMGDKAIAAKQKQRVAEEMAADGWGYGAAAATTGGESGEAGDGWAD